MKQRKSLAIIRHAHIRRLEMNIFVTNLMLNNVHILVKLWTELRNLNIWIWREMSFSGRSRLTSR